MSTAWGSMYVNDFIDRGRVKRVYIQGEMASRLAPEDFGKWYVRNAEGKMVPRSEEHTSELQSLMRISYAVFCLKKKTTVTNAHNLCRHRLEHIQNKHENKLTHNHNSTADHLDSSSQAHR